MTTLPSQMLLPRRRALQGLAGAAAALALPAWSQAFPSRPVTFVLPFPAGGSFDPVMRSLAEAASRELGQPVVLTHKPGAGGVPGTAALATLPDADGYTVALMHNSVLRQPLLQKTAWDPLKDFTYLGGLAGLVTGVCVAADAPWKTLGELLADARARPGQLSWGNVGAISINRITAERLARAAGGKFNMIPFKGGGEAFTALIGRHLDVYGDPGFGPQVLGGKVRLLATFSADRLKRFPQVPTVRESGHDLVIESLVGLVAPRGLDPAVAARLSAAFLKATQDPEHQRQLDAFDFLSQPMSADAYRQYAVAQVAREKAMLDEIGFKPE
jgi:tripartite-type tricarboxylate transporter receptor subunit TctC